MSRLAVRYSTAFVAAATVVTLAVGGRVSMKLSGGKTASVEMRDAGFCNTSTSLGTTTMRIFAFGANNKEWAVTMRSSTGMPKAGTHVIDPATPGSMTAGLIDKTVGAASSEWVRYEAATGSVTFSLSDSTHVAGSFAFAARPTWPATGGRAVSADGTFEATVTEGCNEATKRK